MFIDDIRIVLNPDSGQDYKKDLLQQYAGTFKKCSGSVSEWMEKPDRGAEIRDEAWKLFYEYCRIALELAVSRGKGVCELENTQSLANGFLSVLFSGREYTDEVISRLNYIAKRAFDAAWNRNADPYSPMDDMDSFRQMVCCHLEQDAEAKRATGGKTYGNEAFVSMETQLLKIAFDQSRFRPAQKEYDYFECLHESALCVLREICRNSNGDTPPRFKYSSLWEARAALKDHIQLTGADSSVKRLTPTWENVCSLKAAVCKPQGQPENRPEKQQEKQPARNRPQGNRH